jgi:hypothetical protein
MILVVVATAYGYCFASREFLLAATFSVAGWVALVGFRGYLQMRQFVAGLDRIAWGMAFFLLATAISLAKAGVLRRPIPSKPDGATPGMGRDRSLA